MRSAISTSQNFQRWYCTSFHLLFRHQSELPYYEDAFDSLSRRMRTLQDLNSSDDGGDAPMTSLADTQQVLDAQLAHAAELAEQLEQRLADFTAHRDALTRDIAGASALLATTRDQLTQLDDTSGADQDLLQRLAKVKVKTCLFSLL